MNHSPNETVFAITTAWEGLDMAIEASRVDQEESSSFSATEEVIVKEQPIEASKNAFIVPLGVIVAFMLGVFYYVAQTRKTKYPSSSTPSSSSLRTQADVTKTTEALSMARRAAMARQEKARAAEKERLVRKRNARAKELEKKRQDLMMHKALKSSTTVAETYCQPASPDQTNNRESTFSATNFSTNQNDSNHVGPIYESGVTRYYHIPHLPKAEKTMEMLIRIAKEFEPILTRRGYQVYSVSEMCCCCDGLDTGELAGHRRRVQAGQKISGVEQHQCGGYNRTMRRARGKTRHSIHLRMRHPKNHSMVRSYAEIVTTMCHELAHCEQQNHSDKFYDLMDEIKQEYLRLMSGAPPLEEYAQSNGGFDIYQPSTGAFRSV